MTWGNASNVTTTHLDSDSDSPTSARVELKLALDELQNVINGLNTANGACGLDTNGLVSSARLPATFTTTGSNNLVLNPNSNMVKVQNFLNLSPQAYANLPTSPANGDVAFLTTDGASATKNKPIYYNGTDWKYFNDDSTVAAS